MKFRFSILIKYIIISLLFPLGLYAQNMKFIDAKSLTLIGKAKNCPEFYHRLDTALYVGLPEKIKFLATLSPGLAIAFKTNSTSIAARWIVKPDKPSPNTTAIAFKGLDLYIKRNGHWEFAAVGKPTGNNNDEVLIQDMDNSEKECLLYLPILSEVKSLDIGVDSSSEIDPVPNPFQKKILIYGTSIVHGIEASRPGMTYPARLSRHTGLNFINLGFSGNARMENVMADCLADIDADVYVIDCVPNTTATQINERTAYMVNTIRKRHPNAPIIVMQSIRMDIGNFNLKIKKDLTEKDENIKTQVEILQKKGVKKLYFIPGANLIGQDHEGTGDGIHPNDLGFDRMVSQLEPIILSILKQNGILK